MLSYFMPLNTRMFKQMLAFAFLLLCDLSEGQGH